MNAPAGARAVALRALRRIEEQGGYANLVLSAELGRSGLAARDRAFVTALVDGTTRMRRAGDFLVDRFLRAPVEPEVRRVLRLGAFQLAFLGVPPHAAVSATVSEAPRRARGLVNAVLRRVAEHPIDPGAPPSRDGWPDDATRLSYPDWIVQRLQSELGTSVALETLGAMNEPALPTRRGDGYVQDAASSAVVEALGATEGELIVDVCAAPGGKTTALAGSGATVVALDHTANRAGLVVTNAERTGVAARTWVAVADGRDLPLRSRSADAVLVDAPCSGLGSLRRRADARWRITEADIDRLGALQRDLVTAAADLVRPGGRLLYGVCTLTTVETTDVDVAFRRQHRDFEPRELGAPWSAWGNRFQLLPTADGRDGMSAFLYARRVSGPR